MTYTSPHSKQTETHKPTLPLGGGDNIILREYLGELVKNAKDSENAAVAEKSQKFAAAIATISKTLRENEAYDRKCRSEAAPDTDNASEEHISALMNRMRIVLSDMASTGSASTGRESR